MSREISIFPLTLLIMDVPFPSLLLRKLVLPTGISPPGFEATWWGAWKKVTDPETGLSGWDAARAHYEKKEVVEED